MNAVIPFLSMASLTKNQCRKHPVPKLQARKLLESLYHNLIIV